MSDTVFNIDCYCEQYYQAVVLKTAFCFHKGYGRLIFGLLEFVPKYMGLPDNLDDQGIKFQDTRFFYSRHTMKVADALSLYRQVAAINEIHMPYQPEPPIHILPRDQNEFCQKVVYVPKIEETFYADNLPFRTKAFSYGQVSHIMLASREQKFEEQIADRAIADWLHEQLLWPLHEHIEYLGSFNVFLPNPHYCRSHMKMIPDDGIQNEAVKLTFDLNCSNDNLSVQLQERVNGELSAIKLKAVNNQSLDFALAGICDEVAYTVFDKYQRIIERSDFAPFIRKIVSQISIEGFGHKKICRDGSEDFVPEKHKADTTSIPARWAKEECPEIQLQHKQAEIRYSRALKERAMNQYLYPPNNGGKAERQIRQIVCSASDKLLIIDPYFSINSANMYLDDPPKYVSVEIIASPGGLKSENDINGHKLYDYVEVLKKAGRNIEVQIAGHSQLHDRFIVVDEHEVWLLGSSLATLGDSFSAIIKMENGEEVVSQIRDAVNKMQGKQTLHDWMENRHYD